MSNPWPYEFREAVEEVFGKKVDRTTFLMLSRRVDHAMAVWTRRYQMTPKQERYAWELLTWSVRRAGRSVASERGVRKPYIYLRTAVARQIERVVHDDTAHEGFKRRAELVDVSSMLQELA